MIKQFNFYYNKLKMLKNAYYFELIRIIDNYWFHILVVITFIIYLSIKPIVVFFIAIDFILWKYYIYELALFHVILCFVNAFLVYLSGDKNDFIFIAKKLREVISYIIVPTDSSDIVYRFVTGSIFLTFITILMGLFMGATDVLTPILKVNFLFLVLIIEDQFSIFYVEEHDKDFDEIEVEKIDAESVYNELNEYYSTSIKIIYNHEYLFISIIFITICFNIKMVIALFIAIDFILWKYYIYNLVVFHAILCFVHICFIYFSDDKDDFNSIIKKLKEILNYINYQPDSTLSFVYYAASWLFFLNILIMPLAFILGSTYALTSVLKVSFLFLFLAIEDQFSIFYLEEHNKTIDEIEIEINTSFYYNKLTTIKNTYHLSILKILNDYSFFIAAIMLIIVYLNLKAIIAFFIAIDFILWKYYIYDLVAFHAILCFVNICFIYFSGDKDDFNFIIKKLKEILNYINNPADSLNFFYHVASWLIIFNIIMMPLTLFLNFTYVLIPVFKVSFLFLLLVIEDQFSIFCIEEYNKTIDEIEIKTEVNFFFNKFFQDIDDKILNNANSHFAFIWPFVFFIVFMFAFNCEESLYFMVDIFLLVFVIIMFFNLVYLITYSGRTSKEISIFLTNQLYYIIMGALILSFFSIIYFIKKDSGDHFFLLDGFYVFNSITFYFKFWVLFFIFLCLYLAKKYVVQSSSSLMELPLMFSLITIFILFIIGLTDIFAIIVAFEILSLFIISLCGLSMNRSSTEAAIKYFCQNVIITGLVFCGLFFSYFIFKTTNLYLMRIFFEFTEALKITFIPDFFFFDFLISFSILMWLLSFFFKLGMFPVNFYVPDIYSGSSSPVILCLSSVIKPTVLFIFITKVNFVIESNYIILNVISCFCILSIITGDWLALNNDSIKRFFGYTSISQYGFLMLPLLFSHSIDILFYIYFFLFVYNISIFFILIILIEYRDFEVFDVSSLYFTDLNLFFSNNFYMKMLITLCVFLMAGVPPLILFIYKYGIFVQMFNTKNYFLLVLMFINVVMSAAYYFRIVTDIWAPNTNDYELRNIAIKKNLTWDTEIPNNSKIFYFFILIFSILYILFTYFDLLYGFITFLSLDLNYEFADNLFNFYKVEEERLEDHIYKKKKHPWMFADGGHPFFSFQNSNHEDFRLMLRFLDQVRHAEKQDALDDLEFKEWLQEYIYRV